MSKSKLVENGTEYLFDRERFRRVFDETARQKNMSVSEMTAFVSDSTAVPKGTVENHRRKEGTSGATEPQHIEDVKEYGKCLKGDGYAFLIRKVIPPVQPEERRGDAVYSMFRLLYDILASYEASDCFTRVPGTGDEDGAWDYFDGELGKVRKELESLFPDKRGSEEFRKLEKIIDETEEFVKSYAQPGVAKRWREINPQINFFDAAFYIINELGMETARELNDIGRLALLPSWYLIEARRLYFEQAACVNSENRVFQNELLNTLALVFENDFGGESSPRVT